jgi:hypothetical protein
MTAIETTIDIAAPPERVWDILMDFAAWPAWNPFIVEMAGDAVIGGRLTAHIVPPGQRGMVIRPRVVALEPGRHFAWQGHFLVPGLFDGRHAFRLEPIVNGTRFHHGESFGGLLLPFLKGTLAAAETGFRAMNEALKARAEAD